MPETPTGGGIGRARGRGVALLLAALTTVGASTALAPAAVAAPPTASITVEVSPAATEGEPVGVAVTADGVDDLYAYDLVIRFDPALLAFDTASLTGPEGGFTVATEGDGVVTVTHTRLGTSPGLSGDMSLASFSFIALGGGATTVALSAANLIGSTAETAALTDLGVAPVALTALPQASPTPSATTPSPTVSASALPAAVTGGASTDRMASSGADAGPWFVAGAGALALLAAGVVLVIRRRQAVTE